MCLKELESLMIEGAIGLDYTLIGLDYTLI